MFFLKRGCIVCLGIVGLLLCATFLVTVDGFADEPLSDGLVNTAAASPMPTGNGDFSELASDGEGKANWFPSIAIDGDGNLHVVWSELDVAGGFKSSILYRMKYADSWMPIETVAEDIGTMLTTPSLALDSSGNVHVVWNSDRNESGSGTDRDIFYKVRTNGEWTATELVSTESDESSTMPSLAVDVHGNVHIAWTDASDIPGTEDNVSVFYKMKTALGWTSTRVIQSGADSICKNAKLVVGSNGDVHISWIEIIGEEYVHHIKHRMKQDGQWDDVEIVRQSPIDIDDFTGIHMGLDSNGRLHLMWSENDYMNEHGTDENYNTWNYHTVRDNGVWSSPELIPVGIYDSSLTLSIDKDDRLHVVIAGLPLDHDPDNQTVAETIHIGYITYHEGSWSEYGFVDLDRMEHKMITSIVVDNERNVHVTWMDMPSTGGLSIEIRYAMIDNSELYAVSPEGGVILGVFVVFIAGLFLISMIVMRMRS